MARVENKNSSGLKQSWASLLDSQGSRVPIRLEYFLPQVLANGICMILFSEDIIEECSEY